MTKYLYGYRDRKLGAYSLIFPDVYDPEKEKVVIERALKTAPIDKNLKKFVDLQLYYLGSWDDVSGQIVSVLPEFLIDMGDYVAPLLDIEKEVIEDGKEEDK